MTLLALLCALAPAADEPGATVVVTETAAAAYHADNQNRLEDDDDYGAAHSRLNLTANEGELSLAARLDGVRFFDRPSRAYQHDLVLERLAGTVDRGAVRLTAGDLYAQLGRGLLLSIRKQDEVGLDLALRGGELRLASEAHALRLLGGLVNPANLDAISNKHVRDPGDALAAASYELRAIDGAVFGAAALYLQPRERLLAAIDRTAAAGVWVELFALGDRLSLYLEADGQRRRLAGIERTGLAGYATADLRLGETALLGEVIWLDDFDLRGSTNSALNQRFTYNRAPTLQRLAEEVLDSPHQLGGRLRLEQPFGGLVVALNGLYNLALFGEPAEVRQLHGWASAEWSYADGAHLHGGGGLRVERQGGALVRDLAHLELDWLQPLGGGFALHLVSIDELRRVPRLAPPGARRYLRGSTLVALERAGWGSATYELGYDGQDAGPGVRRVFHAAILAWEPSDAWRLLVIGGTERGGLKCVAGVCREHPAFAGARVELEARL